MRECKAFKKKKQSLHVMIYVGIVPNSDDFYVIKHTC